MHIFQSNNIRIVRFIHASSNIRHSAKINIITGQLHRLARRITVVINFAQEMANIIHALMSSGHRFQDLWRRFRDIVHKNPQYYPDDSAHYIISTTEFFLTTLRLDTQELTRA